MKSFISLTTASLIRRNYSNGKWKKGVGRGQKEEEKNERKNGNKAFPNGRGRRVEEKGREWEEKELKYIMSGTNFL